MFYHLYLGTQNMHMIFCLKCLLKTPIATTPETLKREGILAGNIREIISLHEVLAY